MLLAFLVLDFGTIIGLIGVVLTIGFGVYAGAAKKENRRLKQQIQGGQVGQQQQQVQNVTGDVVTINNYGPITYNTEKTEGGR